jgi:non-specific serine/threonine protein kinase/serine/threonine-protein kinase
MSGPEKWEKIKEILGAALEKEPSQRPAFLKEACGADDSLRAEVDSLLSASDTSQGLSEGALKTIFTDPSLVSKTLGPYQLLQKLGEGGMGQVWLAEQTSPVRRRVALKFIKAGMYDDSVLRRFQSERQSLAIMDHPAIAKVFDAGATPEGQPYFVMEFVHGLPLTDYCDQKKLKLRDRLNLFIRACEGVQHAHQKAIIHRDLKPANILVVEVDGQPAPRIIDFGLAKSVTPYFSGESLNTQLGSLVGTPGYMSPEQADPGVLDVDTRTDVYSLGVILYELLTGFLPFDADRWKKQRLEEVLRQLREEDPPRPSTKVSADRDNSSSRAQARGMAPEQLASQLRGDLDWITMKAVEKDRARRYGTPSELAADLGRYLKNEPVVARPASAAYRLSKYVRRHRLGVAIAAGLVLLLAGFAAVQARQLRRITRERDRANRIAEFMTNMFKVSNPSEARGNTITAREILDKSSNEIQAGLSQDPELKAQMMDFMGKIYWHLGLFEQSKDLLSKALAIRQHVLGSEHPSTLDSMQSLANTLADQGKVTEADKLYQQILETSRRAPGPTNRMTVMAMNSIALDLVTEGKYPEAEKMQRDILEIDGRTLGQDNPDTLTVLSNLALTLKYEGHFADAEKLNRQALEGRRRTLGADHPDTLRSADNLALNLVEEHGSLREAEELIRATLASQQRILGPTHMDTLESMNTLSMALDAEHKYEEEEPVVRRLLELATNSLGPEHPRTLYAMNNLAAVLDNEKKYAESTELLRRVYEMQLRKRGPEKYATLLAMTNLAGILQDEKQFAEAEKLGREALQIERRKLGDENPLTLQQMFNLSNVLELTSRDAEAEKLLRETLEHQTHVYGPDNPTTALSTYTLGAWAAHRGEKDKAFPLLRHAMEHGLDVATIQDIEKDADLKPLHGDPRFAALVADAHERAAAQKRN